MTLDMTDIKAVWCSRRNIEEESGSLILYTQNPYVMMMTWDHGQSSSRRGFVLSPTPSPHPMFPIQIPCKFKKKKKTRLWLTVDKLDIFTLSLSLFYFSRPHPLVYALRFDQHLALDGMEGATTFQGGKKKSNLLCCTVLVCIVVHIYIVG